MKRVKGVPTRASQCTSAFIPSGRGAPRLPASAVQIEDSRPAAEMITAISRLITIGGRSKM